jgi:hypothetical protein
LLKLALDGAGPPEKLAMRSAGAGTPIALPSATNTSPEPVLDGPLPYCQMPPPWP